METDRELLEAAAQAAGMQHKWHADGLLVDERCGVWNPLTDDGDALRLAVKLGMTVVVDLDDGCTRILNEFEAVILRHMHFHDGPEKATRHAIVRAASLRAAASLQETKNG